jgi:hypothetical protein
VFFDGFLNAEKRPEKQDEDASDVEEAERVDESRAIVGV